MTRLLALLLATVFTIGPAAVFICGRVCDQPRRTETTATPHCALHGAKTTSSLASVVPDCQAVHDATPAVKRDARAADAATVASTQISAVPQVLAAPVLLARAVPAPRPLCSPPQLRI